MIGVPTEPKATGAVLAIKQIPAAYKGLNPKPTNMAAEIATGAPNPAAPSRKAPNEKAMSKAWRRRSGVTVAIKFFIISNCPLFTVILKRKTAEIMIQHIGNNPYNAPCRADSKANLTGMAYTPTAITIASSTVSKLALYPFIFLMSNQNIRMTGSEATNADKARLSKGLMFWVQVTINVWPI